MADSKQIHPLTNHIHSQEKAGLRRRRRSRRKGYVCSMSASCIFQLRKSHLQPKLVEEVVEEVLQAAEHAFIQVAPGDAVEERPGGWSQLLVAKAVELLVSVDGHLEGQQR